MIALSVVNYGLLSIWLNAAIAVIILLHNVTFLGVAWWTKKYSSGTKAAININAEDDEDGPLTMAEPAVAFHMGNIAFIIFLCVINAVAFAIMVDITSQGALRSTLPIERIGSHKWNIKVQIAQTTVLGVSFLIQVITLTICSMGWRRLKEEEENAKEEYEYGSA
ncbi:hypothetical protein CPC08DRAFT_709255 [Agrocybe pediades]|nr:hypothetical protein CPC08DRAFT_709255 [Agrocybe pediades]